MSPNLARLVVCVAAAPTRALTVKDLRVLVASLPSADWGARGPVDPFTDKLFAWTSIEVGTRRVPIGEVLARAQWSDDMETRCIHAALRRDANAGLLTSELEVPELERGRRLSKKRSMARDEQLKKVLALLGDGLVVTDTEQRALSEGERQQARATIDELLVARLKVTRSPLDPDESEEQRRRSLIELRARIDAHSLADVEKFVYAVNNQPHAILVRSRLPISELREAVGATKRDGFHVESFPEETTED